MDQLRKKKPKCFQVVTSTGIGNDISLSKDGYFFCERPGLYFVSLTVMSITHDEYFHVYRNSQYLVSTFLFYDNSGSWHSSSVSLVVHLNRDDKISVKPTRSEIVYGYTSQQTTCITIMMK